MNTCPRCRRDYADGVRFCPADGSLIAAVVDPYIGRVLMGQFQLVSLAGRGAMGTVYRAEQAKMDRTVAVKVLRGDLLKDDMAVQRFLREARAAARLSHPNIVTVHLVGESEDGVPFIVMEFIEGVTLGAFVEHEGIVETRRALRIARQIAGALAEAHGHGIVHRDLKSENILLSAKRQEQDIVKVLDFGIAKLLSGEGGEIAQLTRDGTIFGTPHYIAPEQAAGHDVDGRADLYSLGVILFRMVTGRLPFEGTSGVAVLMRHLREAPPRPRSIRPELSIPLEELIMTALEKNRERRFPDAESFVRAIDATEKSLDVDASQTLMGIPMPQLVEVRQESRPAPRVEPRPLVVSAAAALARPAAAGAPAPAQFLVEKASAATPDDPARTRAGEQGLEAWADGAEEALRREGERAPDWDSIVGNPGDVDARHGAGRRSTLFVAAGLGLLVVFGGAFAVAHFARSTSDPAIAVATPAPSAGAASPTSLKLVEERVAASGGFALRLGLERPPRAGEPNVLHVVLDGANGARVTGAKLDVTLTGAGQQQEHAALRDDAVGYVAEIAFRGAGRHHVRISAEPPAARRFITAFDIDVAAAALSSAPVQASAVTVPEVPTAGRAPSRSRRDRVPAPAGVTDDAEELPVTVIPAGSSGGTAAPVVPHALGPGESVPSSGALRPAGGASSKRTSVADDPYRVLDKK